MNQSKKCIYNRKLCSIMTGKGLNYYKQIHEDISMAMCMGKKVTMKWGCTNEQNTNENRKYRENTRLFYSLV